MPKIAKIFEYDGEGIECVFKNEGWLLCIKNWKPNNDIRYIKALETHYESDEEFVLMQGRAVLLSASRNENGFDIDLIKMEPNKIYHIPKNTWFNTITQSDTKMMYIQAADTTAENSKYIDMTEDELVMVRKKAAELLE
ncbi:MAG: hypothetical protein H6Q70_630 [Firmicutes bacterium]|nr:hypothetical protein [Bacillota bacterium]